MNREREPNEDRPVASNDDQVVGLLREILGQLERTQRSARQQDFSLYRLFGSLLQMFAIVAAIWGATGLLDERSNVAAARLLLACFLQLASISAFAVDRFR